MRSADFPSRNTPRNPPDRRMLPLRKRRNDLESIFDRCQLAADAHFYVIVLPLRRSLGMNADEIEMRTRLARRVVLSVSAVFEKAAEEVRGPLITRSRRVRTADRRLRKRAQSCLDGVIVELEILLWRSFPVSNVGLVPHFPQPALHFFVAVTLAEMIDKVKNHISPLVVIFRRIRPPGVDFLDAGIRKAMPVGLGMRRERLGHESNFDQRRDTIRMKCVENVIENFPTVDRVSGRVFGVDVSRSPFQGSRTVASRQQIVNTYVDRRTVDSSQLAQ